MTIQIHGDLHLVLHKLCKCIVGNGNLSETALRFHKCLYDVGTLSIGKIIVSSELRPDVPWKHGVKDTDYTVSYEENIDAETATATITGKEFLEGSITISFTILPADLTDAEIKLKEEKLVYNGTEQFPSIKEDDSILVDKIESSFYYL